MKKSSHYLDFGGPISLVDVDKLFFISNDVFNITVISSQFSLLNLATFSSKNQQQSKLASYYTHKCCYFFIILIPSPILLTMLFNCAFSCTTRNLVICNQSLCNWHATNCHLQLSWSCLQLQI